MDHYTIYKNRPLPETRGKTKKSRLWMTMAAMEVGDSFLVTHDAKGEEFSLSTPYANAKRLGIKIACRSEGSSNLLEIWRVE